jgi:membrane-bound metal-dependent hydrolase YbcI (DUF457 family)
MSNAVMGTLLLAVFGLLLSWARAHLYRRIQKQRRPEQPVDWPAVVLVLVHSLSYLLLASAIYLVLSWLLRLPVEPLLFIPLGIGALLPDLDSRESLPGRLMPWLSRRLEARCGRLEEWHTLGAVALVALLASPLILLCGVQAWCMIPLGFFSHLLLDLLTPQGIMLFWPVSRRRYKLLGGAIQSAGCRTERAIAAGLVIAVIILLLVVDLDHPEPVTAPQPSYQQILERYYAMRGRTQVFAYIEGSWQISGRPISGRFEILNASGESFIVLDRFSGKVFAAGRSADSHVYLDRIILQSGPSVSVRPVEIHLEKQPLSDAVNIVYQMQSEPGLQYIYVSGDVLLPVPQDPTRPTLSMDYSLTSLRKIQAHDEGHYSLHYLTAAELIRLADLRVETADLVITATYATPAIGPTVTPLPSNPLSAQPAH